MALSNIPERSFQKKLIKEIKERFPDCVVLKNDSGYCQGIPDLTILRPNSWWGELEVKRSSDSTYRANQEFYLEQLNEMSFAATINPENKEEVLNAMEKSYQRVCRRNTRVPKSI